MLNELEKIMAYPDNVQVGIGGDRPYKPEVSVTYNGQALIYAPKFINGILRRIIAENRQRILNELANDLYQALAKDAETANKRCQRATEIVMMTQIRPKQ